MVAKQIKQSQKACNNLQAHTYDTNGQIKSQVRYEDTKQREDKNQLLLIRDHPHPPASNFQHPHCFQYTEPLDHTKKQKTHGACGSFRS
jgi:hypothetical protein